MKRRDTIKHVLNVNELIEIRRIHDIVKDIIDDVLMLLNREAKDKMREAEEDLREGKVRKWNELLKNRG